MVETGLNSQGFINFLAVDGALVLDGVPLEPVDALAGVALDDSCGVLCLQTDHLHAVVGGVVPGLTGGTGTGGPLALGASEHDGGYFDLLPDVADQLGPEGVDAGSVEHEVLMVVEFVVEPGPNAYPVEVVVGVEPGVVGHVDGYLGILGAHGLDV